MRKIKKSSSNIFSALLFFFILCKEYGTIRVWTPCLFNFWLIQSIFWRIAQFLEFLLLSLFTQLKRSDYLFIISQNELYFYSPLTYHTMTHHSTKKRWWHASFFSLSDLSHQWEPSQFATAKTNSSQKHGLVTSSSVITNCMGPWNYVFITVTSW